MILIIAEVTNEGVRPVTWELVAAAQKIKALMEKNDTIGIQVVVPAQNPMALAETVSAHTGMDVLALEMPCAYTSDAYKDGLCPLIRDLAPSHILVAHTSQGRDFAPGMALRLKASAISGVTRISADGQKLLYSRPILNNTRNMVLRAEPGLPVVLTLMPGMFSFVQEKAACPNAIVVKKAFLEPWSSPRMIHKKVLRKENHNQALKQAQTIVAAGRGIGESANLEAVERFANWFSDAAVGASRPLVDMGWIGYNHQVGITGASVAPRLYIACGISGSSQHLAGMKGSDWVVSINKNMDAAICSHSDLCIRADVIDFIEAFLSQE